MIRCFDILIGCNSALIRIWLHPDLDPVKIRIRPDPKIWDPVHPTVNPLTPTVTMGQLCGEKIGSRDER